MKLRLKLIVSIIFFMGGSGLSFAYVSPSCSLYPGDYYLQLGSQNPTEVVAEWNQFSQTLTVKPLMYPYKIDLYRWKRLVQGCLRLQLEHPESNPLSTIRILPGVKLPDNAEGMFENIKGKIEFPYNFDTSNLSVATRMFAGAENFNRDISNWDTRNIRTMEGMFAGAEKFNQDISNWDTRNVENMAYMFSGAKEFNRPLFRDVTNVRTMEGMFRNAESLRGFGIRNWDTRNVQNMAYMFDGARRFDEELWSKPFGWGYYQNWDTSNVRTMEGMFRNAESFQGSGLQFWDTHNVENMAYMFFRAFNFDRDISSRRFDSLRTADDFITSQDSWSYLYGYRNMRFSEINHDKLVLKIEEQARRGRRLHFRAMNIEAPFCRTAAVVEGLERDYGIKILDDKFYPDCGTPNLTVNATYLSGSAITDTIFELDSPFLLTQKDLDNGAVQIDPNYDGLKSSDYKDFKCELVSRYDDLDYLYRPGYGGGIGSSFYPYYNRYQWDGGAKKVRCTLTVLSTQQHNNKIRFKFSQPRHTNSKYHYTDDPFYLETKAYRIDSQNPVIDNLQYSGDTIVNVNFDAQGVSQEIVLKKRRLTSLPITFLVTDDIALKDVKIGTLPDGLIVKGIEKKSEKEWKVTISGVPTTKGNYLVTVNAVDTFGKKAEKKISIYVKSVSPSLDPSFGGGSSSSSPYDNCPNGDQSGSRIDGRCDAPQSRVNTGKNQTLTTGNQTLTTGNQTLSLTGKIEQPLDTKPELVDGKTKYQDIAIFNPTIEDGQCYNRREYLGIKDSETLVTSEEFKKALSFFRSYEMTMFDSVDGFSPKRNLSREEAAKIFSNFAINVLCRKPDINLSVNYSDVENANPTLKPYITLAYQLGVMKGSGMGDGKFRPKEYISKAEVNAVLIRMILKSYLDEKQSENKMWYSEYNKVATDLGIINQGAGAESVLRNNVALMLFRAYKNQVFDWRNIDYFSYVLKSRDLFVR